MHNIITTVPQKKFKSWPEAEQAFKRCDGSSKFHYWLINTPLPPAKDVVGSLCYIVFDGKVRGYFTIVDRAPVTEWDHYNDAIEKNRTGESMIMANWVSIADGPFTNGFQGWRYAKISYL